jgi:fumarate reductase flavoprotein subunit
MTKPKDPISLKPVGNPESGIERRAFLRGALAVGALSAAGALTACAVEGENPVDDTSAAGATAVAGPQADWLGSAPEIDAAEIARSVDVDVLVVGAGISGSMAAAAAIKEGATVAILEKFIIAHNGGSACSFLNSKFQAANGIKTYDEFEVAYELQRESQFKSNAALPLLWAKRSGDVLDWLIDNVIVPDGRITPICIPHESEDATLSPILDTHVELGIAEEPDNYGTLIDALHTWIEQQGATIHFSTNAIKLVLGDDGKVSGVIAQVEDGSYTQFNAARGVIMATGSYASNHEMCKALLSPSINDIFQVQNFSDSKMKEHPEEPLDDGYGIKMCLWAGAKQEDPTHAVGCWTMCNLMMYPYMQVTQAGKRFSNESVWITEAVFAMARQPGSDKSTWAIFDADYQTDLIPNTGFPPAGVPVDFEAVASGPHADTIEELAGIIDVDPVVLKATVDRYNTMVAQGRDDDFGKHPKYLRPIVNPPFYADRVGVVNATVMGGLLTDETLNVVDADGNPIPNLYVAGAAMIGGLFGGGYGSTNMGQTNTYNVSLSFLAGEFAAKNTN